MSYQVDESTILGQYRFGVRQWNKGKPYSVSTGIDGKPTYGYGYLDDNGYWEYPFPSEIAELDIVQAENRIRWEKLRNS